jgi:hypothetical protein
MDNVTRLVFLMPPFYQSWQASSDPMPPRYGPLTSGLTAHRILGSMAYLRPKYSSPCKE